MLPDIYQSKEEKRKAFSKAKIKGDRWDCLEYSTKSGEWFPLLINVVIERVIENDMWLIRKVEEEKYKAEDLLGWQTKRDNLITTIISLDENDDTFNDSRGTAFPISLLRDSQFRTVRPDSKSEFKDLTEWESEL